MLVGRQTLSLGKAPVSALTSGYNLFAYMGRTGHAYRNANSQCLSAGRSDLSSQLLGCAPLGPQPRAADVESRRERLAVVIMRV